MARGSGGGGCWVTVLDILIFIQGSFLYLYSLEPCHNEGLRDWLNLFAIMRLRYVEVLFHMFYYTGVKNTIGLFGGLCYIEACYIKVSLYLFIY